METFKLWNFFFFLYFRLRLLLLLLLLLLRLHHLLFPFFLLEAKGGGSWSGSWVLNGMG